MKTDLRRMLSLIMVLALCLSLGMPAWASEAEPVEIDNEEITILDPVELSGEDISNNQVDDTADAVADINPPENAEAYSDYSFEEATNVEPAEEDAAISVVTEDNADGNDGDVIENNTADFDDGANQAEDDNIANAVEADDETGFDEAFLKIIEVPDEPGEDIELTADEEDPATSYLHSIFTGAAYWDDSVDPLTSVLIDVTYTVDDRDTEHYLNGHCIVQIFLSTDPDFYKTQDGLNKADHQAQRMDSPADNREFVFTVRNLLPNTTYYYKGFLVDQASTDQLAEEPEEVGGGVKSFTTADGSGSSVELGKKYESGKFFIFTAPESDAYAVTTEGFGNVRVKDTDGVWIAEEVSPDQNSFAFNTAFLAKAGQTVYIYLDGSTEGITLYRAADTASVVTLDSPVTSSGSRAVRFVAPEDGTYHITASGTMGNLAVSDFNSMTWSVSQSNLVTLDLRQGEEVFLKWNGNPMAEAVFSASDAASDVLTKIDAVDTASDIRAQMQQIYLDDPSGLATVMKNNDQTVISKIRALEESAAGGSSTVDIRDNAGGKITDVKVLGAGLNETTDGKPANLKLDKPGTVHQVPAADQFKTLQFSLELTNVTNTGVLDFPIVVDLELNATGVDKNQLTLYHYHADGTVEEAEVNVYREPSSGVWYAKLYLAGLSDFALVYLAEEPADTLFQKLKAACQTASTVTGEEYFYSLNDLGAFEISEDLEVPANMNIDFWGTELKIPEDVSLTIHGHMNGSKTTIGGTVNVIGEQDRWSNLYQNEIELVSGTAEINLQNGSAGIPVQAWADEAKAHFHFNGNCELNLNDEAWTLEQLVGEVTARIGEPEDHVTHWISIYFPYVMSPEQWVDWPLAENVVMEFHSGNEGQNGSMTIEEGVAVTINKGLKFNGGSLTVKGTLINNGWMELSAENESGRMGSVTLAESGSYHGQGEIRVRSANPKDYLLGFDPEYLQVKWSDGYGTSYVYTEGLFEEFKATCGAASEEAPGYYVLDNVGDFVIKKSMVIPAYMRVDVLGNTRIVVPEDIVFTINVDFICNDMLVDGAAIVNEGGNLNVIDQFTLNGSLELNNTWINLPAESWNDSVKQKIVMNGEDVGIIIPLPTYSQADIDRAIGLITPEDHVRPSIFVNFDWVVPNNFTIPENENLHISAARDNDNGSMTIPAGSTFRNTRYLGLHGAKITVLGTLINDGYIDLRTENDMPSRLAIDGEGTYDGGGWIVVRDEDDPDGHFEGLDLTMFEKVPSDEEPGTFYIRRYQIQYVLNGGTNHPDNVESYLTEETVVLKEPTYEKHSFEGWYDNPNFSGEPITEVSFGKPQTVYAKWKTDATPTEFEDVADPTAYYYNPVYWAAAQGITSGTSQTTFSPGRECTRGQIVTFLWKAMGSPEPASTNNPFTDVKETDYFYKPVLWAKEQGITSGKTATTFAPGAPCTRGQIVTFLWIAKGRPEPTATDNPFTDVKTNDYFYKPVLWAKENKITSGTSETTFSPGKTCTRAQAMTFLWIASGRPER